MNSSSIIEITGLVVHRLYLSAAHNFFGHHGQPAGTEPVIEVPQVECVAGRGLRGDRFFDYKENYKGQITFFAMETYNGICETLQVRDKSFAVFRRNVITSGMDLNELVGKEFVIQGVRFRGVEECKPCYWMDEAFSPGACEFLKSRGGLRAIILSDGILTAC
jgi:MOSC domain-containing protein YiiM